MKITQARKQLTILGFTMNPHGAECKNWGRKTPEQFHTSHHILSSPFRDVFIGKARGGWYVTSHIKFTARRFRARLHNAFDHSTANIFGGGKTLAKAMEIFTSNFNRGFYNVSR